LDRQSTFISFNEGYRRLSIVRSASYIWYGNTSRYSISTGRYKDIINILTRRSIIPLIGESPGRRRPDTIIGPDRLNYIRSGRRSVVQPRKPDVVVIPI